jgi:hypothetical protein
MGWKGRIQSAVALAALAYSSIASAAITGLYDFEDGVVGNAATTITDTSGLGRNGTAAGASANPVYAPGLYLGSNVSLLLNSNGTTGDNTAAQKVVLPGNTDFIRNAPGATLLAWVRTDGGTGTSNRTIVSISNADATANSGQGAARATIQIAGTTFRALGREIDTGGSSNTAGFTFATGVTYLVAGTFDYVNNQIKLYVNGNLIGTANPTTNWTGTNASSDTANITSTLGTVSAPSATQEYWTGAIDGVRIYNETLSAEQIQSLYNTEALPEPASLGALALAGTMLARRKK